MHAFDSRAPLWIRWRCNGCWSTRWNGAQRRCWEWRTGKGKKAQCMRSRRSRERHHVNSHVFTKSRARNLVWMGGWKYSVAGRLLVRLPQGGWERRSMDTPRLSESCQLVGCRLKAVRLIMPRRMRWQNNAGCISEC